MGIWASVLEKEHVPMDKHLSMPPQMIREILQLVSL